MEYEVYVLDPALEFSHMGEKLYETDDLALACTFCQRHHILHKVETCVYQPRHNGYRDYYKFTGEHDVTAG